MLLFTELFITELWTSTATPYISLLCHQQTRTVIFIFFSCIIISCTCICNISCFPFFLIDRNRKQVLFIKESSIFRKSSTVGQINVQTVET